MSSLAFAALWIFTFAVPWDRLIVLPGLNVVTRGTGALALGMALLAIVLTGRVRRWRVFHTAAFLFVAWTAFAVWMLNPSGIPAKLYTFVQLFLVLWMIWELATTVRRQRALLTAFVFGSCVPALATIALYIQAGGSLKRFSAGGADANSLAMTLALALPMAWYLSLTTPKRINQWIFRAYVPLGMLGTALTGSRGGMLTLLIALLIIPLTMSLSPGRLAAAVGLLGLSGALMIAYVPAQVVERLSSTSTEVENVDFGGRFKLWKAGAHAFVRRPFMGYGVGQFRAAITPELGSLALVAHNSFLSVLVEEGLVGLALYLTMLLSVLASILPWPRLERRFGLVLLATLGAAMMPLTWEDQKSAWFVMAALIGLTPGTIRYARAAVRQAVVRPPAPVGRAPVAEGVTRRALGDPLGEDSGA